MPSTWCRVETSLRLASSSTGTRYERKKDPRYPVGCVARLNAPNAKRGRWCVERHDAPYIAAKYTTFESSVPPWTRGGLQGVHQLLSNTLCHPLHNGNTFQEEQLIAYDRLQKSAVMTGQPGIFR